MILALPEAERRRMVAHAATCYPGECCGFLVGRQDGDVLEVTHALPADNLASRRDRYLIAPEAVLLAETRSRQEGLEVIAIYHSHPEEEAVPSEIDRNRAIPGTVHLVLSMHRSRTTDLRVWRLDERGVFRSVILAPVAEALA